MPRRTHIPLLLAALALGLLSAIGVAACGDAGSSSAETLDAPPLTVDTGATLPSAAATTSTTTTSTTDTTAADAGGATDTPSDVGAATGDTGTATPTPPDTGGGAPSTGGDTPTTTTTAPSNPGGAAPDYQSFCNENPGAC